MPNLVGIGLSQVPTNSMLGGLAYQDPEHASIKNLDLKNLSQINSEIADTAVDVFVYDTRKDSDGGAWRKRTQNTSWYNETLGTATRGTRKEFPAVAVLVLEGTQLTIYDGDDPDLPMWMVFNKASNSYFAVTTNSCVTALNGKIVSGGNASNDRLRVIDFLLDNELEYSDGSTGQRTHVSPISGRNSTVGFTAYDSSLPGVVNRYINDVAMTMLPNAPIDPSTGLPIPTIAVATDGGLSIIKDDGTVVNKTRGANETHSIAFDEDNSLIFSWGTSDNFPRHLSRFEIADWIVSANISFTDNYFSGYNEGLGSSAASTGTAAGGFVTVANSGRHFGIDYGSGGNPDDRLGILHPRNLINNENQNLSAFITSSYNTGYMHGDIKGAFMSDTDTTDAVAAYSDGFSNNNKGWSFADNGSSGISGGNLVIEQNSNARATDSDALNGVATGTKLTFTLTVSGSGNGNLLLDDDGAGAGVGGNTNYGLINATGSYTFTANKTASNRLRFIRSTGSNNYDVNFLNITTEYDRSVNNKGLQVFGTVTKSAVATGADLVAYSGFSASNFLKHLYNSELAPGTAAYSVSCWFKTGTSSGDQYIFDRNGGGSGSRNLLLIMNTSASGSSANKFQFWHRDNFGNVTDIQITDKTITDNVWHQVVALNDGSTYRVYVDGEVSSVTSSQIRNVISDNDPPMFVGIRHTEGSTFMTGSMALFRYSKSAPSPEQIKKMYEDEKCLFHENAKATLYGSSDAVTALAFDDTTNLLHVGTSAGRSEFQGLRRINNTTDAVTTAISASNGLVAEQ